MQSAWYLPLLHPQIATGYQAHQLSLPQFADNWLMQKVREVVARVERPYTHATALIFLRLQRPQTPQATGLAPWIRPVTARWRAQPWSGGGSSGHGCMDM